MDLHLSSPEVSLRSLSFPNPKIILLQNRSVTKTQYRVSQFHSFPVILIIDFKVLDEMPQRIPCWRNQYSSELVAKDLDMMTLVFGLISFIFR
ncbi:hypothetical protein L2E82_28987 [Cichorium intybus]|uniref:Uncharacterized protein n=1 Tax=Cichorium intybus TaxID=13427 RepID=A0ACB9CWY8_CICIN|nr:hypothetical protein L2E82_28987 [Cichorium intybus]